MILLRRNLKRFEYIPYDGLETDVVDGIHTGEFRPEYGDAVPYRGNISAPSGRTQQTFYGMDIRYTHVLVMDKPDADIREHGLIRYKGELYEIQAVRPSMNVLSIALKKQTMDHGEPYPEPDPEPDGPVGETGETGETGGDGE